MKYERLTNSSLAKSINDIKYKTLGDKFYIRLAELEDKIENGTLVELPCKVGDTVYIVYSSLIRKWEVDFICIDKGSIFFKLGHKGTFDYNSFWLEELGDHVFLTKAEAEKRLEELQKDYEDFLAMALGYDEFHLPQKN